jgi:hypothetical protein
MISTKFCPNQINRFDNIRLFVNFNHALAAILDFAHFVPGGDFFFPSRSPDQTAVIG